MASAVHQLKITIAAGTYDGVLAGWELLPGRQRKLKLMFASPVHGGSVRGLALAAAPPSAADKAKKESQQHRVLVSCGYDESLQLHDFTKRRTSSGQLRTPAEYGTPVCLQLAPPPPSFMASSSSSSPLPKPSQSTHCLVGFSSGKLVLYQKKDWSLVHVMAPGHTGGVSSVAVHPSGKLALSAGRSDGKLQLWDLQTGKLAYGHKIQSKSRRSSGHQRYEPVENIVWSPLQSKIAESASSDPSDAAGSAYAYCHGQHVTVRDVASGKDLLDVELPTRVNQICFLQGESLFVAAAGNDGSLAVLKVGSPNDKSVERRAIMAIEPVDGAVAGEERFKCLQHVTEYIVATANSAGVVSVMDLRGAVNMINDQPEIDESSVDGEASVNPASDDDDDDNEDEGSVELAVDLVDSIQLGTGARITCLAAWAEAAGEEDDLEEEKAKAEAMNDVEKGIADVGEGPKRKRPVTTNEVVLAKDDLVKARALVSKAKKIQEHKEKKRQKKRHG